MPAGDDGLMSLCETVSGKMHRNISTAASLPEFCIFSSKIFTAVMVIQTFMTLLRRNQSEVKRQQMLI